MDEVENHCVKLNNSDTERHVPHDHIHTWNIKTSILKKMRLQCW